MVSTLLLAPVAMTAGGLAYLAALVVTGELRRADLQGALSALRKRKATASA